MQKSTFAAIGVVTLLGLTACSSDSKLSISQSDQSKTTIGTGASGPDTSESSGSGATDATTGTSTGSGSSTGSGNTIPGLPGVTLPDLTGLSIPDLTGLSIPDLTGLSIPDEGSAPGASAACASYLSAFGGALAGQSDAVDGVSQVFAGLVGHVPANIEAAVKELSKDFAALQTIYAKYGDDLSKISTDPDFVKLFASSDFSTASSTFSTWVDAGCPKS
ncbi:MAG: hypothetical protein JWM34_1467 [Ilumatobacteraceae bacterium]|nr:hypothetical protein [Ilumatobacteraceae bacterium]